MSESDRHDNPFIGITILNIIRNMKKVSNYLVYAACIVAIAASCIPMYARVVESSLLEISKGKVEAAKSIGSSNAQIIFHVLLPETLPSLIRGWTITVIAVLSMTALAGMFGAGGIGDIAVRYGYQRFQHDKLLACIYVLVVIVQTVQSVGNFVSNKILKTRGLI